MDADLSIWPSGPAREQTLTVFCGGREGERERENVPDTCSQHWMPVGNHHTACVRAGIMHASLTLFTTVSQLCNKS